MTQRAVWTHGTARVANETYQRGDTIPAKVWNELGTNKRRILLRTEMVEILHDEDERTE